ncbi:MAG: SLBB domain-containing protein [Candidatus Ratteibacteria bacterium]|nr:SLBB domain-containing protein [Candidatus Ratteibacteria bacterium]
MKKCLCLLLCLFVYIVEAENTVFSQFSGLEFFSEKVFSNIQGEIKQTGLYVPESYILGMDDEMVVNIWGVVEEEHRKRIDNDGAIFIPGIGKIYIEGKTLSEARDIIQKKVLEKYKNISVSVTTGALRKIEVFVLGEVKKPGSYVVSPMTSILEVIALAGGPGDKGSLRKVRITKRKDGSFSEYDLYPLFLSGEKTPEIQFSHGDIVFVPLVESLVGIKGAVKKPAVYELTGTSTIDEVVKLAGGALPNADLSRLQVERIDSEKGRVLIDIEPGSRDSFVIQNLDLIILPPLPDNVFYIVSLEGAVKRPGNYGWQSGMKVSDILKEDEFLPYALKEKAEIIRTEEDGYKRVIVIYPDKIFRGEEEYDIQLVPMDKLIVYSQERMEKRVVINGQVRYPGEYVIERGDRLSDLVKRAGGFTKYAYLPGIIFLREEIKAEKEKQVVLFTKEKEEVLKKEYEKAEGAYDKQLIDQARIYLEQLKKMEVKGRIPLNITDEKTLLEGKSEYNIPLEDGDVIYVPVYPVSVAVTGEVNLPTNILFNKKYTLAHYIQKAGGYTKNADKRNIFIAKVNGTASYDLSKIEPGDTIVVPFETRDRKWAFVKDIAQMFYHISLGISAY